MRLLYLCQGFVYLSVLLCGGCSIVTHPCPGDLPYDSAVTEEIDAVSKLTFDNAKKDGFENIAKRPHLPPEAQAYLVEKTMKTLTFENSKLEVLLALIKNPDFLAEGKKAVLSHLDEFTFDSSKQKILNAINRKGPVPSGHRNERILIPSP